MQTYETLFVTAPTLSEEEEKATVDGLSKIVDEGGGSWTVNERLGRKRLAYPIEKHNDGVYTRFLYDAEAAVPKELERRMRLSDRVLRALTVRLEPNWAVAAKEQAVRDAQARAEAAERAAQEAAEQAEREARGEVEVGAEPAAATPETATPAAEAAPPTGDAAEEKGE